MSQGLFLGVRDSEARTGVGGPDPIVPQRPVRGLRRGLPDRVVWRHWGECGPSSAGPRNPLPHAGSCLTLGRYWVVLFRGCLWDLQETGPEWRKWVTGRGNLQGYSPHPLAAGALCFLVGVMEQGTAVTCHLSGLHPLSPESKKRPFLPRVASPGCSVTVTRATAIVSQAWHYSQLVGSQPFPLVLRRSQMFISYLSKQRIPERNETFHKVERWGCRRSKP